MRRIEALTGDGARAYLVAQDERVREVAALLRTKPDDVVDRVKALIDERRTLEKQLADAKRQLALGGGGGGGAAAEPAPAMRARSASVKVLRASVQGLKPKDLRGLVDEGKAQVGSGIVAIVGVHRGRQGGSRGRRHRGPDQVASAPSISSRSARKRSAARAAAAVRTWRRPAAPTARKRPMR